MDKLVEMLQCLENIVNYNLQNCTEDFIVPTLVGKLLFRAIRDNGLAVVRNTALSIARGSPSSLERYFQYAERFAVRGFDA